VPRPWPGQSAPAACPALPASPAKGPLFPLPPMAWLSVIVRLLAIKVSVVPAGLSQLEVVIAPPWPQPKMKLPIPAVLFLPPMA